MVDGRTRLAAEVEQELRRTSASSSSRRPCPARFVSQRRRATGCPRSPTTAARPARRPTGRWRWSLSSVADTAAPRPRPRPRGADRRSAARPSCCSCPSSRSTRTRGSRAAASSPRRPPGSPTRSARQGVAPAGRRPPSRRGRLGADRRRAPLARGARGGRADGARGRAQGRRPRLAAARRSSRTSPASSSRRSRRRARTPSLIDEFALSLGEVAERVGPLEAVRLEPPAPARAARRRPLDGRARRADRGPRPGGAGACRTTKARRRLARRIVADGLSVRAAEQAARWAGAQRATRRRPPRSIRPSPPRARRRRAA